MLEIICAVLGETYSFPLPTRSSLLSSQLIHKNRQQDDDEQECAMLILLKHAEVCKTGQWRSSDSMQSFVSHTKCDCQDQCLVEPSMQAQALGGQANSTGKMITTSARKGCSAMALVRPAMCSAAEALSGTITCLTPGQLQGSFPRNSSTNARLNPPLPSPFD